MPINNFSIALVSFLVCVATASLLRKITLSKNFLVQHGIPLIGGIAIGISFILASIVSFLIERNLSLQIIGIIIGSLIILIFGIIDDWKELSIKAKFIVQLAATTILYLFGTKTQIIYIGSLLNIVITFIWVVGITNAFNHLDVMDGLAGGVAIIIGGAFLIISFLNLDSTTLTLSLALLGSVCGFIVYNLPPAKIYMGNSGSHFLGFIIAAISLLISYAPLERKIALLSPPLILGFPIFDTLFLCIMRLGKGKSAFRKSNDHLALRFLKLGYAKNRALLFMLILTLFFSICGVMLSQVPDFVGIIIIILVIALSITITLHMGRAPVDD